MNNNPYTLFESITPELIAADSDVRPLSAEGQEFVKKVMAKFDTQTKATVHETLHGHVVTIKRKEGRFVPGTEGQAGRMDADDALFFLAIGGKRLRWFEVCTDRILLGIDDEAATHTTQAA